MSNFDFLKDSYKGIFQKMLKAESRVFVEPKSAAHYCRLVLEEVVFEIYKEELFEMPYDTRLANLMREYAFKNAVPSKLYSGVYQYTRKIGNDGAHFGSKVKGSDAEVCIKYLFDFLKWFANYYAVKEPDLPGAFDISYVPKVGSATAEKRKQQAVIEEMKKESALLKSRNDTLQKQFEKQIEDAKASEESFTAYNLEQLEKKTALGIKKESRKKKLSSEYTEAETRTHLIDIALREAGWDDLEEGQDLEYPVNGMPITSDNPRGNGFVDYVLWDDNGLPLAVIEAKRTSADTERGKHQASLYADCLEKKYKQRPIIFYSNGYVTQLWDDTFYSYPRRVYGFYTKDELQWEVQKRDTRTDIRNPEINKAITNRPYQEEAIKRMAESFLIQEPNSNKFRGNKRAALLVMATGSGKTRTSASIVDILFKNKWIKRVLFLADRNALVTQAKNAFGEHLSELSAINLSKEKEDNTTRLVFSTYQSVINKIDNVRNEEERFYGVGHFDLIIVDEAHRSVYNKFGVIFEYFDALLLGLTATPKREIDHNTYELFDCVEGDPTYAYELEDAVNSGFLVPYRSAALSTKFLREGIKYSELSQEDKMKYEASFRDNATGLFPELIGRSALNRWLFNKDTVNKILDSLMTHGIKIEGGDKLGRTIIFASNQEHANFIVKCFEERYPQLPPSFIAMIHNKVSHAQSLIERFCDHHKENNPQVAVSVDMMDTGIDAPRVVNLLFFKVVRSYSKFWQMIGRGTRLCPDVFGPGQRKTDFLILDACDNFAFFEENENGKETKTTLPISQQIFNTRLAVARLLLEEGNDEDRALGIQKIDKLHKEVAALDKSRFDVNMKREFVDEFENRERWNKLDPSSMHTIQENLTALVVPESINELARRFDLMMLKMMQANLLKKGMVPSYRDNLIAIGDQLSKKYAIPQVLRSKKQIEHIKEPRNYKGMRQKKMEEIREEIRELIQFLDAEKKPIVYINVEDHEDEFSVSGEEEGRFTPLTEEVYKRRVETFVRENKTTLAIDKLNKNLPLTESDVKSLENILFDGDERGDLEKFKNVYGDEPLGVFIRSIVGLDMHTAQEHFAEFLNPASLTADQISFIQTIIQFLNVNGVIDKNLLDKHPFDNAHENGLYGLFGAEETRKIIALIDRVNENAEVG